MKSSNLRTALVGIVFLLGLMIPINGNAQSKYPSLENLRQRNVALEMEGFDLVAGMRPNQNGKPNGNGFDLAPIRWSGSGFIAGDDGSIITNYHVARRAIRGRAKFDDGSSYDVRHIKIYSPKLDLAILKISGNRTFPTVRLGNPKNVQPLDKVLAIGNPQGMGINMTEGQVSQVVRDDYGEVATIVHTAPITSGNSGGALYKEQEVIGVNASVILASYGGGTAFNQAIPIVKAQRLLEKYYEQNIPFKDAFPTDVKTIIEKKFKLIDGANGRVAAAQGNRPGMYPFNFRFSNLEDYLIVVDSPGKDLAIGIFDSANRQIGFGDMRQIGIEGILISSDYAKNVIIYVVNYDPQPANFGIKIGYISW